MDRILDGCCRHGELLDTFCQQCADEESSAPPAGSTQVDGELEGSIGNFEHRALACIEREQNKIDSDNALVVVLCDAVRLGREYAASMKMR